MRLLVAVAYLSLAPVACGSEPPVPVGETRVLFASDFAIGLFTGRANGTTDEPSDVDDAFALSLALDHPTLDLRGIAVGFGNNRLLPEVATATAVTELLDLSVPVAAGAVQPLPLTPIVNSEGGTFL